MKFIRFLSILLIFVVANSYAARLRWDTPTNDTPTSYRIYWGTSAGNYTNNQDIAVMNEYQIDSLPFTPPNTYYIAVKALNGTTEFATSNEVTYVAGDTTPPAPPTGVQIVSIIGPLNKRELYIAKEKIKYY